MAGALMLLIDHFTLCDKSRFLMFVLDDNFNFFLSPVISRLLVLLVVLILCVQ